MLESRLQPGSILSGQGAGWSLWADNLSILDYRSGHSESLISETRSEAQKPGQPSTPAVVHRDPVAPSVSQVAVTQSEPLTVPSQQLVDPFTPDWLNDNLFLFAASSQPHAVPVSATESPITNTNLARSAPINAGPSQSPIGVAAPPVPVQLNPNANSTGTGSVSAPVTPTRLPTPTATSIASSVHAANLHETRLNLQTTPVFHGINTGMTTQNFSTFLGGPGEDGLTGVGVDSAGNIYVSGYLEVSPGSIYVFVASLDPTGSMLNWTVAVNGGFGPRDEAHGIAVFDNGAGQVNVYVVGSVSNAPGSPVATDGFVVLLNGGDGSILNEADLGPGDAQSVTVDPINGDVFVAGTSIDPSSGAKSIMTAAFDSTLDTPSLYTVSIPLQDANGNNVNSFVHGSQSIAIDSQDNVYITGTMTSADGTDNSPVVVAYNGFNNQSLWQPVNFPNATYGGAGSGGAIVNQASSLYVTGTLFDNNGGTTLNSDLLLARLNIADGSQYFIRQWVVMDNGARDGDWTGNGMVLNGNNEPIVTGAALDPTGSSSFPATNGVDVHVTHFGANGNVTQLSTERPENTFGGSALDVGNAVILDPTNSGSGSVLVVGTTQSSDFPTTTNAYQATYGGGLSDGFLASVQV
jgi:hypothetical protein